MEEYLEGTLFEEILVKGLISFVPDHMKAVMENKSLDYNDYGTENEIKAKQILHYFSSINAVLSDLDITFMFFKKDRALILEHYSIFESQGEYYNFFFENYYIRLLTLSDISAKLGVLLYPVGIELEKANAYNFKDKSKKEGFEKIAELTQQLIDKFAALKKQRNEKLHTGVTDITAFEGVVIWSDLNKMLGEDTEEILERHTDDEINKEIELMENNVKEIIDLIKEFLEESTENLKEILEIKNES